ncbi:MAG: GntR family transcriptional regulator [Enterococcus sp.]
MVSKYEQIAKKIREEIREGYFEQVEPLPTQEQFATQFHTSRMTIQKALDLLRVEGIVESRQGSGTYIKKNGITLSKLNRQSDEYVGLSQQLRGQGEVTSRILRFDLRFPTEIEQGKLAIQSEEPVYDIVRVRLLEQEPLIIEEITIPVRTIPKLSTQVLHRSIYGYIEDKLGLVIGASSRRIRAERSNQRDQEYLNCCLEDPILHVEQVVFLEDGTPFEYSHARHRHDKGDILVVNLNKKTK